MCGSLVMLATLPGRTFGLGLITTRLLTDFEGITETRYAVINLIAALIGAAFCLPAGWLLDRFGARRVLAVVLLGLAGSVFAMSRSTSLAQLTVSLTLTRGLGQSMLSVLSLAMLGKWFGRGAGLSMGAYAVLMTMLLATAFGLLGHRLTTTNDWRLAWSEAALVLLALTPVICLTALRPPRRAELAADRPGFPEVGAPHDATLGQALRAPCFWLFALAMSLFALASSGVLLFLQPILAERGITESVYQITQIVSLFAGLLANLVGGLLSARWPMNRLLAVAMLVFAGSLVGLTFLDRPWHAYLQAVSFGLAGGLVTVLFFTVWVRAFGRRQLGRIQGAAQLLAVIGSSAGPLVVAQGREIAGTHMPVLLGVAGFALVLGLLALWTVVPAPTRGAAGPRDS